jgi:hypothetical protein
MTDAIDHAGPTAGDGRRASQTPCRMEAVFPSRKGGIYGRVKLDVSRLLVPGATRRIPRPRTRRDGASELPGIS